MKQAHLHIHLYIVLIQLQAFFTWLKNNVCYSDVDIIYWTKHVGLAVKVFILASVPDCPACNFIIDYSIFNLFPQNDDHIEHYGTCKTWVLSPVVKVTLRGQMSKMGNLVGMQLYYSSCNVKITCNICSSCTCNYHMRIVQTLSLSQLSRSHFISLFEFQHHTASFDCNYIFHWDLTNIFPQMFINL